VALAGSKEAVIGGDRRAISFLGSCANLEEELYSGQIKNDEELLARAQDLGATLQVSDGREKVWKAGGVLVGEVTEISEKLQRRRRIYLVSGAHLVVDITGSEARISSTGKVGCVVFGNRITQRLAAEGAAKAKGRLNEAVIESILVDVADKTASVSREHTVLRTDARPSNPDAALMDALQADCQKNGWRLGGSCALQ
jgi:hypothetical protein